jgi:hypothetical protein
MYSKEEILGQLRKVMPTHEWAISPPDKHGDQYFVCDGELLPTRWVPLNEIVAHRYSNGMGPSISTLETELTINMISSIRFEVNLRRREHNE